MTDECEMILFISYGEQFTKYRELLSVIPRKLENDNNGVLVRHYLVSLRVFVKCVLAMAIAMTRADASCKHRVYSWSVCVSGASFVSCLFSSYGCCQQV